MIEGLKLTMSGAQLRQQLALRIDWHRARVLDYERERSRAKERGGGEVGLPPHVVEHMRDEHESRVDVLTLIHDHLIEDEIYRLGEADLIFAELIPDATAS